MIWGPPAAGPAQANMICLHLYCEIISSGAILVLCLPLLVISSLTSGKGKVQVLKYNPNSSLASGHGTSIWFVTATVYVPSGLSRSFALTYSRRYEFRWRDST